MGQSDRHRHEALQTGNALEHAHPDEVRALEEAAAPASFEMEANHRLLYLQAPQPTPV